MLPVVQADITFSVGSMFVWTLGYSKLVEFLLETRIFFFIADVVEGSALLEISESTD